MIQLLTLLLSFLLLGTSCDNETKRSRGGTRNNNTMARDAQPMRDVNDIPDILDTVIRDAETPDQGLGMYPDGGSVFRQTSPVNIDWVYSGPANLYFSRTEITVAQFDACLEAGRCMSANINPTTRNPDCNFGRAGYIDHPINCINWQGADEFCK